MPPIIDGDASSIKVQIESGRQRSLAAKLFDSGFSVLPSRVGSKIPFGKYAELHQTKQRRTRQETLRRFKHRCRRNCLLMPGQLSGGVIVLDFDDFAIYRAWAKACPRAAASLPTVRTRRGAHVYLIDVDGWTRSVDLRFFRGLPVEIKGDRSLIVAVGSVVNEEDGKKLTPHEYHWIVEPEEDESGRYVIPRWELKKLRLGRFQALSGAQKPTQNRRSPKSSKQAKSRRKSAVANSLPPTVYESSCPPRSNNNQPGCERERFATSERPLNQSGLSRKRSSTVGERSSIRSAFKRASASNFCPRAFVANHPIDGTGQRNDALISMAVDLRSRFVERVPSDVVQSVFSEWWAHNGSHCRRREPATRKNFTKLVEGLESCSGFVDRLELEIEALREPPSWLVSVVRKQELRRARIVRAVGMAACAFDRATGGSGWFASEKVFAEVAGRFTAGKKSPTRTSVRRALTTLIEARIIVRVREGFVSTEGNPIAAEYRLNPHHSEHSDDD